MPPDHRVGRDHDQVPPPVAAQAADEHPQQPCPAAGSARAAGAWVGSAPRAGGAAGGSRAPGHRVGGRRPAASRARAAGSRAPRKHRPPSAATARARFCPPTTWPGRAPCSSTATWPCSSCWGSGADLDARNAAGEALHFHDARRRDAARRGARRPLTSPGARGPCYHRAGPEDEDEMPPVTLPMDLPFPTFVVGSLPRPQWVRELIEDRKRGDLSEDAAQALLDDAVLVGDPAPGAGGARLPLRRRVAARELRQGLRRRGRRLPARPDPLGPGLARPAVPRGRRPAAPAAPHRGRGRGLPQGPHRVPDHRGPPVALHHRPPDVEPGALAGRLPHPGGVPGGVRPDRAGGAPAPGRARRGRGAARRPVAGPAGRPGLPGAGGHHGRRPRDRAGGPGRQRRHRGDLALGAGSCSACTSATPTATAGTPPGGRTT